MEGPIMHLLRPGVFSAIALATFVVACQRQPSPDAAVTPSATPMMLGSSPSMTTTAPADPSGASPCALAPIFTLLRERVGAATVGTCVESEREIPGNGNVEQRTTGGTMMRRALDGRLLFVGASQTWIDKDGTLFTRPADQRFEWEGDRQLVEALRQGGYTVYFRHGQTDPNQRDTEPNNLANCGTQRNLTEAGRQQARVVGEALRALKLPADDVRTSEYCRAREYSHLLFERDAEVEPALVLPDPLTEEQRARNTESLKVLLSQAPPMGTNRYLVAHSPNIKLAAGVDLPEEGGAAVFRVEAGTHQLVARIVPSEWPAWARALAVR
jgi:phosphohistidine phosphatase SixA